MCSAGRLEAAPPTWRVGIWIFLIFCGLLVPHTSAQRLSALAPVPDWNELEAFQETITREEFVLQLDNVYAPAQASVGLIEIDEDGATIRKTLAPDETWRLRFAKSREVAKPAPQFWRTMTALGPVKENEPLAGFKIALDPGHLGGEWARLEERWFQIGASTPVTEGDLTLRVAQRLAPLLRAMGAEVFLVRNTAAPTTTATPESMEEAARAQLTLRGITTPRERYDGPEDPERANTVQAESEILFYRVSEIRHRARIVNTRIKPDLTVCIHFNAEAWGDPLNPALVTNNHLHLLVNGTYSAVELRNDDLRFEMLYKLLSQTYPEELRISESVAASLAEATQLPPYEYPGTNAKRVGTTPYVWARNLLANRLYRTPVIFLEPYVMNSEEVWTRIQAGDYEGQRMVAGIMRKNIFTEYAEAVAEGLAGMRR